MSIIAITAAVSAALAWLASNWPDMLKAGDIDGAATAAVMGGLLLYLLGARGVGRWIYWIVAAYIIINVTA